MKGGHSGTQLSRDIPDAFSDGWGRIPDDPLVAASVAALFRGGSGARSLTGGWSSDREERLTYRHTGGEGGAIVVSLDPDAVLASEGGAGLDSQWSYIERISPLTIDVLIAVLAQISGPGSGAGVEIRSPVPVTARAVLRYKGLQRWGAEGAALRRRVDCEIGRLHGLRFDVGAALARDRGPGHRNTRGVSSGGEPVFEIVDSTRIRSARKGSPASSETVWRVRAGQWAQRRMESPAGVRFWAVPRLVLEFDHRRNRGSAVLAKKIGLGAMIQWPAMASCGSQDRRIGDLLAEIGELPRRAARGGRWGGRMRGRFEDAIRMLQETGVLGRIEWPAGYGPDSADRSKGWVGPWLAGRIILTRPEVPDASCAGAAGYLRSKRDSRIAACELPELRRGSVVRAMRIDRAVPQCRLASELGVSAAYLSQIENERRMASQAVLERIARWMRANGAGDHAGDHTPAIAMIASVGTGWQTTEGRERQLAGGGCPHMPAAGATVEKDDRT